VTHTEGLYTHKILVECKHWKNPVQRTQIDAMITAIDDLSASKGVFFTTAGYQSGAETMAKANGIDIFIVRELSDVEWGAPGRVIDLTLQIFFRAIGNVTFPGTTAVVLDPRLLGKPLPPLNLAMVGGEKGLESSTPVTLHGKPDTLERILNVASMTMLKRLTEKSVTFNNRADCTVHLMGHAELPFDPPLLIPGPVPGFFATCPKIECDIGVRVVQSRIHVDRSDKYLFALAVEDCVSGAVYAASRENGANVSILQPLNASTGTKGEPIQKGSLMRVIANPFFDFAEISGLTPVSTPEIFASGDKTPDTR
jgi:hypothetical protein